MYFNSWAPSAASIVSVAPENAKLWLFTQANGSIQARRKSSCRCSASCTPFSPFPLLIPCDIFRPFQRVPHTFQALTREYLREPGINTIGCLCVFSTAPNFCFIEEMRRLALFPKKHCKQSLGFLNVRKRDCLLSAE